MAERALFYKIPFANRVSGMQSVLYQLIFWVRALGRVLEYEEDSCLSLKLKLIVFSWLLAADYEVGRLVRF